MRIGLFDSGFGGLTVVREVKRLLPGADVEFCGDNKRAPYGNRARKDIVKFSRRILDFLAARNIDIAIIACNTATVAALEEVKDEYPFPILGVIESGVKGALAVTKNKKVGVIATRFTIENRAHQLGIHALDPDVEVVGQVAPQLVVLVEGGQIAGPEVEEAVRDYLKVFRDKDIDTLILGCTHFAVLSNLIQRNLDPGVVMVDPATEVVKEAKVKLKTAGVKAVAPSSTYNFYTSGNPDLFRKVASSILGWPVGKVEKIVFE